MTKQTTKQKPKQINKQTNKSQLPYALLYFTGDKETNIILRRKCKEIGYKLNEYNITPIPKEIIQNETDIFNFLGYEYIPPKYRDLKYIHCFKK